MHDIRPAIHCFAWTAVLVLALAAPTNAAAPEVGVPLDLVFSIDSSGSMGPMPPGEDPKNAEFYGKDIDRVRIEASKEIVRGLNPRLVRVGLVSWDEQIDFTVPVSDDYERLLQRLDDVDSRGRTDLDLGLRAALDLLRGSPRKGARKVAVFLTDGMSEDGIAPGTVRRAQEDSVTVYTIGLQVPVEARDQLTAVAATTGGRYFAAPDAEALRDIFEAIIGQVTEVFLELDTPDAGEAGAPLAFEAHLVDRSGYAVVALEEVPVEIDAFVSQANERELVRREVGSVEALLPVGASAVSGEVAVGHAPGLVVLTGTVPALGVAGRRVVPVAAAIEPAEGRQGRFELVMEEPSVVVGRPLSIQVVHLDARGHPAPTAENHDLLLRLTPRPLSELLAQQSAALPLELPELTRSAFAQALVRSLRVEPDGFVEVDNAIFEIRAVFRRGSVAFTFSAFALEPLLFEVELEVDGEPVDGKDLIGFAEWFGSVEINGGGLVVWANPGEIRADGKARAYLRVLAVFPKAQGSEEPVLTCLPPAEKPRTLLLGASRGGALRPPVVRPLSRGCNAIIDEPVTLTASHVPGVSVIEAIVEETGGAHEEGALFGHGSVVFLAIAPLLPLAAAAGGGLLGAALREYRRLEETQRGRIAYRSLIGPFLIMGVVIGPIFYGGVYYASALLPWTTGFAVNALFALLIGAVAGYIGPRTMEVLRDLVFRKLGVGSAAR
jgi:hypothetical protein